MASCHLYKLPNELLLHILTPMPTPQLLPLTALSHRIYTLILRVLHNRLVAAAELESYSLLLECYHPSAKLTEPPYFCTYHGTDGLKRYEELSKEEDTVVVGKVGELQKMYSRFRPHRRELERGGRRVRPPGDVPGSRTFPISGTASDRYEGETVKQILGLDGHELFTQLVAQSNLVKIGPRNGLFTSFVEIEEGVVRVWREWLRDMASSSNSKDGNAAQEVIEDVSKSKEAVREVEDTRSELNHDRVLWVSTAKNTGLKFNIKERKLRRDAPILIEVNEDMPVSYEVEYDELLIRTWHLLLMLEKSLVQEDNSSGKAVVFGSFG
ncbi:F-box domain-containing protein [Lophiostoma macrostomum CBS 122681]|uniref:F-box domain-containing protein n=1 Tax=Lophiostoma macrostomum CBS 122681 TaxID=1314788 RepID=A0A6A6TD25_9PLEO|nr:F-box domain-containing protein [Lophiostoma macrostomum CBS 122681]